MYTRSKLTSDAIRIVQSMDATKPQANVDIENQIPEYRVEPELMSGLIPGIKEKTVATTGFGLLAVVIIIIIFLLLKA